MQRVWLGEGGEWDELLAEDAVIEEPFAPPGRPRRFNGRAEFVAFAGPQRANFPVRFEEIRNVVIHDTTDPEVIVVEYELVGVVTTTGRRGSAPFVGVLRVRDGKTVLWREYQNVPAIAGAVGRLPELLAAYG
jgi:ketosteroid isomerase-like protein